MTFSGFVASRGDLGLVPVVLVGVLGSQVGSLVLFAGARLLPEDRVVDPGVLIWLGSVLGDNYAADGPLQLVRHLRDRRGDRRLRRCAPDPPRA